VSPRWVGAQGRAPVLAAIAPPPAPAPLCLASQPCAPLPRARACPPHKTALDEDGHEARNNAAADAADPGAPAPATGTPGNGMPLAPLHGQLGAESGVPAPEAMASAAGASAGVGPDMIVALARSDASTAAK
jgi:hypothetical protein